MGADLLWLAFGLLLLTGGGETVVRGAIGMARALGVSTLVIGLTVVAFGTSAPELAVNVIAALSGRSEISFGNIFGSNMANIGLIVGCTALLRPILVTGVVVAREIPMMLLATAVAVVMAFDVALGGSDDEFSRPDGIVLLLLFMVFLYYTIGDFVRQRSNNATSGAIDETLGTEGRLPYHLIVTLVGLAALVWGADVTVEAASDVAREFGVSEVVIGLTVLAVGTSLPEFVASVIATMRSHPELAIGNVVGSNIFNLLLVMGTTSVVRPVEVPPGGHLDVMMVAALSLVLFMVSATATRRIIRGEAVFLLVSYFGYIVWRSTHAT